MIDHSRVILLPCLTIHEVVAAEAVAVETLPAVEAAAVEETEDAVAAEEAEMVAFAEVVVEATRAAEVAVVPSKWPFIHVAAVAQEEVVVPDLGPGESTCELNPPAQR